MALATLMNAGRQRVRECLFLEVLVIVPGIACRSPQSAPSEAEEIESVARAYATYTAAALIGTLHAPAGLESDQVGVSLASSARTLFVGAPGARGGAGAVHVFDLRTQSLTATFTNDADLSSRAFGLALTSD